MEAIILGLILIFAVATLVGIMQRIRWSDAARYNMPVERFPQVAAAHPDWIVPRPMSWRALYGAALIIWLLGIMWQMIGG